MLDSFSHQYKYMQPNGRVKHSRVPVSKLTYQLF